MRAGIVHVLSLCVRSYLCVWVEECLSSLRQVKQFLSHFLHSCTIHSSAVNSHIHSNFQYLFVLTIHNSADVTKYWFPQQNDK